MVTQTLQPASLTKALKVSAQPSSKSVAIRVAVSTSLLNSAMNAEELTALLQGGVVWPRSKGQQQHRTPPKFQQHK